MNRVKIREPRFNNLPLVIGLAISLFIAVGCSQKTYKLYDERVVDQSELAELRVPSSLSLLAFNGDSPPLTSSLLAGKFVSYQIGSGEHAVKLRYRNYWEVSDQNFQVVQSRPLTKEFTAEPGSVYEVQFKELDDVREAELFSDNFDYSIVKASAKETPVVSRPARKELRYQNDEPKYVREPEPVRYASKGDKKRTVIDSAPAAPEVVSAPKGGLAALELLKFWWGRASDEERKLFERWTKQ